MTTEHEAQADFAIEVARRQYAQRKAIEEALEALSRATNGGSGDASRVIADELARIHPTLSGQIAKGIAIGIIRRSLREEWSPFGDTGRPCPESGRHVVYGIGGGQDVPLPVHADHDGRHSCELVIGAEWMARQGYI